METVLSAIYEKQQPAVYTKMQQQITQRKAAIQKYCWNEEKGFFFDYQYIRKQQTSAYTLAAVYPLFCRCATPHQSHQVALRIEENFLKPGGLITTLDITGQQWDAPNGWAPLQWIAYKGLQNYGHKHLAARIRQNWLLMNEKVYAATGKMMEKYNVSDTQTRAGGGEYPNQDGFGWTNGVYLKFLSEPE